MATIDNVKGQENPIIHYAGDLFDEVWSISRNNGEPYDMTGKEITLSIKKRKSDATAEETLSTTDSSITISGDNDEILTFNKVVDLDARTYFYDLQITTDNYTVSYGTWEEVEDVT